MNFFLMKLTLLKVGKKGHAFIKHLVSTKRLLHVPDLGPWYK